MCVYGFYVSSGGGDHWVVAGGKNGSTNISTSSTYTDSYVAINQSGGQYSSYGYVTITALVPMTYSCVTHSFASGIRIMDNMKTSNANTIIVSRTSQIGALVIHSINT